MHPGRARPLAPRSRQQRSAEALTQSALYKQPRALQRGSSQRGPWMPAGPRWDRVMTGRRYARRGSPAVARKVTVMGCRAAGGQVGSLYRSGWTGHHGATRRPTRYLPNGRASRSRFGLRDRRGPRCGLAHRTHHRQLEVSFGSAKLPVRSGRDRGRHRHANPTHRAHRRRHHASTRNPRVTPTGTRPRRLRRRRPRKRPGRAGSRWMVQPRTRRAGGRRRPRRWATGR
jgi:hypothetical protein